MLSTLKSWLLRLWDWLTYRPWTPEELHDRVALSVANTCYRSWHGQVDGPPVTGRLYHGFTPLTAEEIAERDREDDARRVR